MHEHNYFLTIVYDFSKFVWIILLKNKSEVSNHVKKLIQMINSIHHYSWSC